jgi:hypothetical protein
VRGSSVDGGRGAYEEDGHEEKGLVQPPLLSWCSVSYVGDASTWGGNETKTSKAERLVCAGD